MTKKRKLITTAMLSITLIIAIMGTAIYIYINGSRLTLTVCVAFLAAFLGGTLSKMINLIFFTK